MMRIFLQHGWIRKQMHFGAMQGGIKQMHEKSACVCQV